MAPILIYFYVIADNDNTVVEVTPTIPVQNRVWHRMYQHSNYE